MMAREDGALYGLGMRVLFRDARIVDGTGAPSRHGDVLVEDGFIRAVGGPDITADEVIDARGAVLAPGFIDMHSHSDFTLPGDPEARAKVMQGVTTEVVGNCGLGISPANERVEQFYAHVSPMIFGEQGGRCFRDLSEERATLERNGVSVNVAQLVPHGNVRAAVMGLEERAPTAAELDGMRQLVGTAMSQGAFGLSTGLVYPPGAYAETEEIIELAKVAAAQRGMYATHMRDEGARLIQSVEEALRIGREADASVQISHHKAGGRFNWGKVKRTLKMVEDARAEGLDVHSDVYPYAAGSTVLSAMFVPLWAFEGSQDKLLERLKDPPTRERIKRDATERFLKFATLPGVLDKIVPKKLLWPFILAELSKVVVVSSAKKHPHYEGRSLALIAKERRQHVFDMILDLLIEEDLAVACVAHVMSEDDVSTVLAHPTTMVGTDGFPQREGKPHPRTFGTYPRVLEHYVRNEKLISLESAVHKMTGMVASKLGLADRGVIREDARADLVLFHPDEVHDRATFADPRNAPEGFQQVMTNGVFTVRDGAHTGARPGRVLSRS